MCRPMAQTGLEGVDGEGKVVLLTVDEGELVVGFIQTRVKSEGGLELGDG